MPRRRKQQFIDTRPDWRNEDCPVCLFGLTLSPNLVRHEAEQVMGAFDYGIRDDETFIHYKQDPTYNLKRSK